MAGPTCGFPQLAGAVDAIVVCPELSQCRTEHGVALGPRGRQPCFDVVIGAQGHPHACAAQDGDDGLDPELGPLDVDEGDYFLCWQSSSAPKKLAARFRISLVIYGSLAACL
ncbi:hypothetical protein CRM90_30180 [Mycobacterium sp. ENV421]|nr:hypothetical protein CRM90_30180 [Mycobacterium sp. ENV421]